MKATIPATHQTMPEQAKSRRTNQRELLVWSVASANYVVMESDRVAVIALDWGMNVDTVMLGRGIIGNPGLIRQIKHGDSLNKNLLKEFHDRVYEDYKKVLFGERTVLFKMKEIWFYMIGLFTDNEKYAKRIKKAEKYHDYEEAVERLFREQDILKIK